MGYQNISYVLPQADIDAVKAAIVTITSKLPFLITLSNEEIKSMVKLGEKSADFAGDALSAANSFPAILPASFDRVEFGKDTNLFKALSDIKILLDSLSEKVDDTYTAVGSEAMTASLEVYAYVQTAKERVPGIKSVAEKLEGRFKNNGPKKKKKDE